jgi:hypothetical protein
LVYYLDGFIQFLSCSQLNFQKSIDIYSYYEEVYYDIQAYIHQRDRVFIFNVRVGTNLYPSKEFEVLKSIITFREQLDDYVISLIRNKDYPTNSFEYLNVKASSSEFTYLRDLYRKDYGHNALHIENLNTLLDHTKQIQLDHKVQCLKRNFRVSLDRTIPANLILEEEINKLTSAQFILGKKN